MDLTGHLLGGKYKLKRLIASGGSADVYVAQPFNESRACAVKVLFAEEGSERFIRREVATLKKLKHPYIVGFIEDGYDEDAGGGAYYIALELVEGTPIDRFLDQDLPLSHRLALFLQIIEAVAYAHGRDVIHRDLKPANVHVVLDDVEPHVKVLDFGIAAVANTLSPQHTVEGYYSDLFASPEQIQWKGFTPATDVFSLSVLFLYLLAEPEARQEARGQHNREPLKAAARRALGEGEEAEHLLATLERATSEDPDERPLIDHFRSAINALRERRGADRPLTFFLARTFSDLLDLKAGAPGRAVGAVRAALQEGGGHLSFKLLPPREGAEGQASNPSLDVGNDAAGRVFRGFFDKSLAYIVLHTELNDPETELQYLADNGVTCTVTPVVFDDMRDVRSASANGTAQDLHSELEAAYLRSQSQRADRRDRKDNQTFGTWRKITELKQVLLNEEKVPLRYRSVSHDERTHTLTVTLDPPAEAEKVALLVQQETQLTISVEGGRRRTRPMPCGHAIGTEEREGLVHAVTVQLPVELKFDPEEISRMGTLEINRRAEDLQLMRERYALESAQYGDAENPDLFRALASPADVEPIQPVTPRRFFDEHLDDNQREAVGRALGTNDLFLIQGPPGTGKTSVITEIILQILTREPHGRILVSSQSNIAVDNVLVKLGRARASEGLPPDVRERLRIVRIGKEDRIELSAQDYRAERAALVWQREAAARSDQFWESFTAAHAGVLDGVEKLERLGKVAERANQRDALGHRLLEAAQQASTPYTPARHEAFERSAYAVDELVWEKVKSEEALREAIDQYADRYGVLPPDLDTTALEWLTAEQGRLGELLGPDNEHLKQYEALQSLQREWRGHLERSQSHLLALYLEHVRVVGATCSKAGDFSLKDLSFDWVIIDEAGRATPAETLVAAVKGRRVILVGDHKQLPPVVDSEFVGRAREDLELSKEDLEESLFEHLYRALPESNKTTLRHQYRMHPGIGELVGELFYKEEGLSSERVNVTEKEHGLASFDRPVYWVSTSDVRPRQRMFHQAAGKSFRNAYEAGVVAQLLRRIEADCARTGGQKEVGVITPYASQLTTLEQAIEPNNAKKWPHLRIAVHTIDAFQGKDCDIVVFDLVRSHEDRKLGFTSDFRRLNVALSRAKQLLVIVGNDFMAYRGLVGGGGANPFKPLIHYIESHDGSCRRLPSLDFAQQHAHGRAH